MGRDGASRGELDEYAVSLSLGLTPGDYKDKSPLRREKKNQHYLAVYKLYLTS